MKIFSTEKLNRKSFVIDIILFPFILLLPVFAFWAILKLIMTIFAFEEGFFFGLISLLLIIASIVLPSISTLLVCIRRHRDLNQSWIIPVIIVFVLSLLTWWNDVFGVFLILIYFIYLASSKTIKDKHKENDKIKYFYCTKCGNKNLGGTNFCEKCGEKL